MRWLTAPAAVSLLACAALAQDEALQTRRFVVAFLTAGTSDVQSPSLSLAQDAIGTTVTSGEEVGAPVVDEEDLVRLLKRDVDPASWSVDGASLRMNDGLLVAVNRRPALDGVAAWLARARGRHARRIVVDAALVVVPFDRWGRLKPDELPSVSKVLKAARLFAAPGARVQAADVTQLSYIRDHDVQISTGAVALDPIIDVLNTGVRFDLRVLAGPAGERVLIEVRAEAAAFEGLDDRMLKLLRMEPAAAAPEVPAAPPPVAKDGEVLVQLPRTTFDHFRGQVAARPGETVIAGSASRADGILALLLTPTFSGETAAVADPPGAFTRLYDISAITAKVQDGSLPDPGLSSPSRGGGGPLTGATFTLDEPKENYGAESLLDEIKALVGPKEVERLSGNHLAVLAVAEKQALVERRLSEIFAREVRTLTTEAAILAFKPGARAAWAKTVPALAPGGSRATGEALALLLEEARKGLDVHLAAHAVISGRPWQRVHAAAGRQRAYVQDFEPQVATSTACFDPIIGVLLSGLGLEVRPTPRADDGSTTLQLKAWMSSAELVEEKRVSTAGGPVQRPKRSGPVWESEVVCLPGHWTLAALESREDGELALFVRVR